MTNDQLPRHADHLLIAESGKVHFARDLSVRPYHALACSGRAMEGAGTALGRATVTCESCLVRFAAGRIIVNPPTDAFDDWCAENDEPATDEDGVVRPSVEAIVAAVDRALAGPEVEVATALDFLDRLADEIRVRADGLRADVRNAKRRRVAATMAARRVVR